MSDFAPADFIKMSDTDLILSNQAHILMLLGDLLQKDHKSSANSAYSRAAHIHQRQQFVGRPWKTPNEFIKVQS